MMAAAQLGVKNDQNGLDYFLTEQDKSLPDNVTNEVPSTFIAIVIGAKHSTKRLPLDKIRELCSSLKQNVILLGGPEDKDTGELISKDLSSVKNYCGELTIGQSAFLISKASLVITHDTGLMHIAAAFQKRIISIWGNTVPEFGMYPYVPKNTGLSKVFEVGNLNCRPCSKIGYDTCPKRHFKCMNDQDIDGIKNMATQLLTDSKV
jgi:ADP-heptose:LPS heptosyltransferase